VTAARDVEVAPKATIAARPARRRFRWQGWFTVALGSIGVLAAGIPMLWAAATIALQRPLIVFDGDQALEELGVMRAVHLSQWVGTYSRFGWNHPGPAWYYSLAPVYAGLGGQSWSLSVAVLVLHGLLAACVVISIWRQGGPQLALICSALLLLYVRAVGEDAFRAVWTVYALMLPMVLLFIMAAAAAAGSTPAMLGAFVAGSYAVQTHVGTAAVVLSLLATAVVVRLVTAEVLRRRTAAATGEAGTRAAKPAASRLLTGAGTLILVLMWLPVAIDEVRGRPGNLTKIWQFFTLHHDRHSYHEAISAFGRMLAVYPFGHLPAFLASDFSTLPAERGLLIAVFTVGVVGLVSLGVVLHDRFAQALGLLLLAAMPVAIVSISRVVGPIFPYLLIWVTAFPLVLAVGWAVLLVRAGDSANRWRAPFKMAGGGLGPVLAIAVVALAVGRLTAFQQLLPYVTMTSDPDTRPAWAMTQTALAAERPQPILIDMAQDDRWVPGSAMALQLAKQGWTVKVTDPSVFMFGYEARSTGRERLELVVMDRTDPDAVRSGMPDLQPIGHAQNTYLFLRRRRP
jgi:hypothetical protein